MPERRAPEPYPGPFTGQVAARALMKAGTGASGRSAPGFVQVTVHRNARSPRRMVLVGR